MLISSVTKAARPRKAHPRLRGSASACFAAIIILASCKGELSSAKRACEPAVLQFHQRLDSGQYDLIYSESDNQFRKTVDNQSEKAFLQNIHERLGRIQASQFNLIRMDISIPEGKAVTVIHTTKFERGAARERFVWRVNNDRAFLVAYFINSDLLDPQDKHK